MPDPIAEAATLPFRIVETMGVPCGYERSFKLSPRTVLANRYLLGIETARTSHADLFDACRRMGMPEPFREAFSDDLHRANLVLLGFEAAANDTAIHKIYLEFWEHVRARLENEPADSAPRLLHRGFKWQCDRPERRVITDYRLIPGLSTANIVQRIEHLYAAHPGMASLDAIRGIVSLASRQAAGRRFLYVEVGEQGNDRSSFDLNLYPAELRVAEIRPHLLDVMTGMEIPTHKFERLMSITSNKLFGHLSAGVGRDGSEYLSVYYEN